MTTAVNSPTNRDTFMKEPLRLLFLLGFLSFFAISGCNTESGDTVSNVSPVVSGTPSASGNDTYQHVDQEGGLGSFQYTQNLGSAPQDVFFIFTNTNSTDVTTASSVSSLNSEDAAILAEEGPALQSPTGDPDLEAYAREHGVGLRGTPQATAFNANPPDMNQADPEAGYSLAAPEPLYTIVGDTHTFMNSSTTDTIPSTLRQIVTDGSVTLNIWVANDAWDTCSKWYCLNQTMVDAVAGKFLKPGNENDIYDWMTNVFGAPWGTHIYNNLISATAAQTIDILFFDISNDGNLTNSEPNGGILGFFWSKDNYLVSSTNYSNQRLLFYMDSVLTAKKTDATWEISDYWPAEMVSTLAHEFQHMIHFYQKTVSRASGTGTETWINEMTSMVAEDLLADKIAVNGPRGVAYSDYTAGSAGNTGGRLPLYNRYNYIGPTVWYSGNSALINYAINYSFGAYLARNFGGAALFQKVVQSSKTDYQAITSALTDLGYSESLTTLLQKWGVTVLLSNRTNATSGYQYNTGSKFTSTLNGITYNLGSSNMFNYTYSGTAGPYLYTSSTLTGLGGHYKTSNTYVQVGTAATGTFTKTVSMASGIKLTVVTKSR